MGADFIGFVPGNETRMSYTTEMKYKVYLIRMFSEEKAMQYMRTVNEVNMSKTAKEAEEADKKLQEIVDSLDGPNSFGARTFISHSDCSGWFSTEECKYIGKAFYALLETAIVEDEEDRDCIQELADVFRDTADEDGIVMIQ